MPFRRKILYYGIMLLLTLLALEGMARIAYYAAYGQWYGGGGPTNRPVDSISPDLNSPGASTAESAAKLADPGTIRHPFYGYSGRSPSHPLNAMPPRQRQDNTVLIALVGGSIANQVQPFLQEALNRWFAANRPPQQPLVIDLTIRGAKQPQQALMAVNALLLGGEFDLLVNLDGFNEVDGSVKDNFEQGLFPFYPRLWDKRAGLTGAETLLAGRIGVLRREQARLAAVGETSPLRWSAWFGLANRYRRERTAAQIIRLNHELAAIEADYSLEKHGPRSGWRDAGEIMPEAVRFWYRSSVMLDRLAALAGAEYYHFLQPNQYLPGSKPLSPEELEFAYRPGSPEKSAVEQGYPLLTGFNRDLQNQGINYFDLTGIFADHTETLYRDECCHVNDRGNELLAAELVRRLEPALRRLGRESPARPVSALYAARRPAAPLVGTARPPAAPGFQVSLAEDGKQLRYVRPNCLPEDADPWFFLHLLPRDWADLPYPNREQGFDNQDFLFWEVGGRFAGAQCALLISLPDYPIAALRTGQHIPGRGPLWTVELIVPVDPGPLRATYTALSAIEPMARDYFDLYDWDNQLIYLRETCAAADTAAGFFLHIVPENPADLPAERRAAGFVHSDFDFAQQGGHFDGKCLAAVPLPNYPIKEMRTGQHIPGAAAPLWSVQLIAAPDYAQLRAEYAALSATEPAGRDYFALYRWDNRLFYLRESCAVADTVAGFFLHIVPENPADLPAERRDAGFAHAGFEFVRQGGHFDGKCLASVALPEYLIKEMRTGQYVPGQGDLWSVELVAAD